MKTSKMIFMGLALLGMFYNGQAREVKNYPEPQKVLQGSLNAPASDTTKTNTINQQQASWAKQMIGQKFPEIHVDHWVSKEPEAKGKFTVVYFWNTLCRSCLKSIPHLNEYSKMFKNDLVIIGVANDDSMERMKGKPVIEFYRAVDKKKLTYNSLDMHALSYLFLVDPQGIVRWQGLSKDLTEAKIKEMIAKYK